MAEDFSKWVLKSDAAEALGYSDRTLERKIIKHKYRTAYRDVPGRRPFAVIHPDDYDKLKACSIPATPASGPEGESPA